MTGFRVVRLNLRREEELDQVFAVLRQAYLVEARILGVSDFPPLRETRESIRNASDRWIGVRDGDRLAGVLSFEVKGSDLTITRLAVHPDYFRRGAASLLLRTVLGLPGPKRFEVTTGKRNAPAVRCYLKHGFRVNRHWAREGIELVTFSRESGL